MSTVGSVVPAGAQVSATAVNQTTAALNSADAVDITERAAQWNASSFNGYADAISVCTANKISADRQVFPVGEEDVAVGKRELGTEGVRSYSRLPSAGQGVCKSARGGRQNQALPGDRPATAVDLKE